MTDTDEGGVDDLPPFVVFDAVDVGVVMVVGAAAGADEVVGNVARAVAAAGLDYGLCVWGVGAGAEGNEGWRAGKPGFGAGVYEIGLVADGCEGVSGPLDGGWDADGSLDAGWGC